MTMRIVSVTGAVVNIEYHEPSTDKNGALTDLSHTTVYLNGVKYMDIPASSPSGGGLISTSVDTSFPVDAMTDVTIYVTATDLSGNESVPSIALDRVAPDAPF